MTGVWTALLSSGSFCPLISSSQCSGTPLVLCAAFATFRCDKNTREEQQSHLMEEDFCLAHSWKGPSPLWWGRHDIRSLRQLLTLHSQSGGGETDVDVQELSPVVVSHGLQPMGWCGPRSARVFPAQSVLSGCSLIGMPRGVLPSESKSSQVDN